ncbi:hypothetical protein K1728_05335 [Weissella confusa]|uniref:hypothetical protein n=1 Tax=Weissella confusa TaxID=1583 RepID=UPI001C6F6F56|nr:hypothetical protein [Weissella confusa]QYU58822.1 hypothetical protein K1728_05335 [Weissella confusa]
MNKALRQTQSELSTVKKQRRQADLAVSQPKSQQQKITEGRQVVQKFVQTFSNTSAAAYSKELSSLATRSVINELMTTFAPSVTFSQLDHYDVPIVAYHKAGIADDLQYLAIAKSATQSVAYEITYNADEKKVTDVSRRVLKEAITNEN